MHFFGTLHTREGARVRAPLLAPHCTNVVVALLLVAAEVASRCGTYVVGLLPPPAGNGSSVLL